MFSFSVYATQGLHGLVYGMLLFLVASGLTLVFGMMGILNIAHAAFYMLGAYVAYTTVQATGSFWLSLLVAPIVIGLLGAAVERWLLRRTHAFGHAYELLLTFGLFFMISEGVRWIWGSNPLQVPSEATFPTPTTADRGPTMTFAATVAQLRYADNVQ